jgi:membrane protein
MKASDTPRLLLDAFEGWRKDNAPRLGAALAFYTLFSLAPLLVLVIAIAGILFGRDAAQGKIVAEFEQLIGTGGARAIEEMIEAAWRTDISSVAALIGTAALLLGATGAGAEIKGALNTIWKAGPSRRPAIWNWVQARLTALALVVVVGFLLLVSLVVSALISATDGVLASVFPEPAILLELANALVSFLVITALFAMMFKVLPDPEVAWGDVWIGAFVTSLLFTSGKTLLGLYLGRSSFASVYGAAGSLVMIVLWVYYAAQILYYGAEITHVYAHKFGSRALRTYQYHEM